MTCHQMLSPLLRRLCVSSETSSTSSTSVAAAAASGKSIHDSPAGKSSLQLESNDFAKMEIGKQQEIDWQIQQQQQQMNAISSEGAATTDQEENSDAKKARPRPNFRTTKNQETLTKEEARKRMLSWRKTTKPRAAASVVPTRKPNANNP